MESLRLTAHTIGAIRTVQQDVTVLWGTGNNDSNNDNTTISYRIPRGSTIAFCHIVPNTCPVTWGSEKTAAETFSLHHPMSLYQDEYHNFTTFSCGIHRCPGKDLALQLVTGLVGLLLVDYDVDLSSSSSSLPALSFERATLAQREGPIMVRIRKKNHQAEE
jgi:cytochrome P450